MKYSEKECRERISETNNPPDDMLFSSSWWRTQACDLAAALEERLGPEGCRDATDANDLRPGLVGDEEIDAFLRLGFDNLDDKYPEVDLLQCGQKYIRTLVHERDELKARVKELEEANHISERALHNPWSSWRPKP